MTGKSLDAPPIAFSTAVYRLLLSLYPARFQQEYGPQMAQAFRDCCRRAFRQGGTIGMIELWVLTLFDLARSAAAEHTQKETGMTNSNFVRLSGWALILSAVSLLLFFIFAYFDENNALPSALDPLYGFSYFALVFGSPVLLAVGLLGLRSRYGARVGVFGRTVLLVGVVAGPALSLIGIVGEAIFEWEWAWGAQFAGLGVMLACLALFGIPVLSRRPLPRWNALPLLAGIWYPLIVLFALAATAITGEPPTSAGIALYTSIVSVQCVALFMLGYVVQGDAAQERPAFA